MTMSNMSNMSNYQLQMSDLRGASRHTHPVKVGRVRPGKPQASRRVVPLLTSLRGCGLPGRTRPTFTGWLYQDALLCGPHKRSFLGPLCRLPFVALHFVDLHNRAVGTKEKATKVEATKGNPITTQ